MSATDRASSREAANACWPIRQASQLITLAHAERTLHVPLRDANVMRERIVGLLDQLRVLEARSRALQRDASDMRAGDVLVAHMKALEQWT